MNKTNYNLTPTQVLRINHLLRSLGLNTSYFGTKLLNKTIQYIIKNNVEFITLDNIYKVFVNEYGFSIKTIRNNINNAITKRNTKICEKNFERIFGYEYDEYIFVPKYLIEEIITILKNV